MSPMAAENAGGGGGARRGLYARAGKPALDLFLSGILIAAGIVPALLIAIAIKLESRGPVFYRQERIGRDGRPFRIFKFRSMVVGAERQGAGVRVEAEDRRVTRVGRMLRRASLDELPQLLNVIRGEMSIVGPRPTLRYQVEQYDESQRRRLRVKPGITGWAQVQGRCAIPWDQRIPLDIEYVERMGFGMDLRVLARTFGVVLRGGGRFAERDYWGERAGAEAKRDEENPTRQIPA
jgi:lipopolysaccharide/colanic/teichoic acid biosynthesis glycosyltransferase